MKNNFKEYRNSKGLSQIEFCEVLNIAQSKLSKIELGEIKQIPIHILDSLKEYDSSVDIDYILGYTKTASEVRSEENWKDIEIERLTKELEEMKKWRELLEITLKGK